MGTTPIYGFPYPDPSDLVANYPALGQQLAEDIEGVLPTLAGTKLITSNTPNAVSSVIFNNCFSSAYDNYVIFLGLVGSTDLNIRARLRLATTDDSGANYDRQVLNVSDTTVAAARVTGQTQWDVCSATTGRRGIATLTVGAPFLVTSTSFVCPSEAGVAGARLDIRSGTHSQSSSYDGITFLTSTGTISGFISIYGYKN
jgi:hypothetical protein